MTRARTKLLVLLVVAIATVAALRALRKDTAPNGQARTDEAAPLDDSLIDGRLWVEGRPDKLTDYVHASIFISRANFGLFERASTYDMRMEFFDLTRKDGKLKVFFPQTKKSAETSFTVKECKDKAPFDLCLDLAENPWGGPKRYYGFQRQDDERAALGDLAARIRAHAQNGPAER